MLINFTKQIIMSRAIRYIKHNNLTKLHRMCDKYENVIKGTDNEEKYMKYIDVETMIKLVRYSWSDIIENFTIVVKSGNTDYYHIWLQYEDNKVLIGYKNKSFEHTVNYYLTNGFANIYTMTYALINGKRYTVSYQTDPWYGSIDNFDSLLINNNLINKMLFIKFMTDELVNDGLLIDDISKLIISTLVSVI